MKAHSIVVVGAGIGGLVAAALLAQRGFSVTVVEAAPTPGGKIRQVHVNGAAIDSGPTVFTMQWIFDEIYRKLGTRLEDQLRIVPLPVIARHAWADGSRLDLFADPQQSIAAVHAFAGAAEADRFEQFCFKARSIYDHLEPVFIRQAAPNIFQMIKRLGPKGLAVLMGLGPLTSLWTSLGKQLKDQRLRQLFARYATYCGSSPWLAPATLMLIAQVEMDGVWAVEGGMFALAKNMEALAIRQGVQFRYNTRCAKINIRAGTATGITLPDGEVVEADAVVFNGDEAALRAGLLGPAAVQAVQAKAPVRSLSALTWSVHSETKGFDLDRHNVFFQPTYKSEFIDIFQRQQLPEKPTVYVCAQDRGTSAPHQGPERLLVLVNAPALGDTNHITEEAQAQCQQQTQALLTQCGLHVDLQGSHSTLTTPVQFNHMFPATGGALYGQATHGWSSAFSRSNASSKVQGLFLVGGSVHPGPGVPMAAMSGQLAVEALMAHRSSTKQFHPGATFGGTSTL